MAVMKRLRGLVDSGHPLPVVISPGAPTVILKAAPKRAAFPEPEPDEPPPATKKDEQPSLF